MTLTKKLAAEFIGTFWLVLGGCGSAVLAATFPDVGIGLVGVSLAFGLTVLTMAFAIGHISVVLLIPLFHSDFGPAVGFPQGSSPHTSARKSLVVSQAQRCCLLLRPAKPDLTRRPASRRTATVFILLADIL